MSLFTKTTRSTTISALMISSAALLLAACADISENKPTLSEAESCSRLKGLIKSHRDQFKQYKKSLRRVRNLNSWSAEQVFPSAENCNIWEWSSGLHTYICDWQAGHGKESAIADYNEGRRIIENCLGPAWQADSQTTRSGERTLYQKAGVKTVISLRYLEEPRSWFERWHTVVAIGDKNNLNAPLQ